MKDLNLLEVCFTYSISNTHLYIFCNAQYFTLSMLIKTLILDNCNQATTCQFFLTCQIASYKTCSRAKIKYCS